MAQNGPVIRKRSEHCVSRRSIDPDALKVLCRLSRSGQVAYLVGGGVRDLLLGREPKDFDVSTDAHPQQIKKLFRNAFLIGRRFRLAHIRFGTKVIETSTFRRQPELSPSEPGAEDVLLQHQDNTFGTPEEDALRRDFTVNGLFYDIRTFDVIDYVGGLKDLKARVIRSIGDPNVRFLEDPVRMVRAVRFAARLGFRLEKTVLDAIRRHHAEIRQASAPRLLEEIYRLFGFGTSAQAYRLLYETGLMADLLPELQDYLDASDSEGGDLLWRSLAALDDLALKHGASAALMVGTLMFPVFRRRVEMLSREGRRVQALDVARDLVVPLGLRYHMPKRVVYGATHMLSVQDRFASSRRFSKERFMAQSGFQEALDLYEISVLAAGDDPETLAQWRKSYADFRKTAPGDQRASAPGANGTEQASAPAGARRRRRPRRRSRRGGQPPVAAA